ncbi:MAG: DUF1501 domain-containing protein [Myxococcaceae bacterium]|jgi:uncharacterized protein (DUF1501 family)|nr:DUF1501 domain-containing protein [Myxococcaceae bacterium]MCA3015786.1 DUF1501 domain-containing protein [Myxococcaceae bacterium]
MKPTLSRRSFLEVLGVAGGGLLVQQSPLGASAFAQPMGDPKYLLVVYFAGGWDQLLALDPRPQNDPQFQVIGGRTPATRIQPAYDLAAAEDTGVAQVMTATGGSGVQTAGALTFGPAVPQTLLQHASDFAVVRGMQMDTLTHEVGRRYLITGKFPRGLVASGSSLNTQFAAQTGVRTDVPNLAMNVETYNEGLAASASAVSVGSFRDLLTVMQPQAGTTLPAASNTAIGAYEQTPDSCTALGFNAAGLVDAFKDSRTLGRGLMNPTKAALFDFRFPATTPAMTDLYTAFGITTSADLTNAKGRAAVAGQALANGVSQVVAVTLGDDLDDHFDWAGQQPASLRAGFDALGRLIAYLKTKQAPGTTKSVWQCTSLMVFSEFARTPLVNTREGRDHHLTSSALLAGPGIRGNTVFGASTNQGMGVTKWNFRTGAMDATGGGLIRPPDVHATLLKSMGLSFGHLSNQNPVPLDALIR